MMLDVEHHALSGREGETVLVAVPTEDGEWVKASEVLAMKCACCNAPPQAEIEELKRALKEAFNAGWMKAEELRGNGVLVPEPELKKMQERLKFLERKVMESAVTPTTQTDVSPSSSSTPQSCD